jgi:ribosome-associated protein
VIDSGAEAKGVLAEEGVVVNGERETRRGRQIRPGDVVAVRGREIRAR